MQGVGTNPAPTTRQEADVQTFGPRSMPTDWLARFREVEPSAWMVDAGHGFWMVGALYPGDQALAKKGARLMRAALATPEHQRRVSTIRKARAALEIGFAFIALYSDAEIASGWAFDDFELRDWRAKDPRRFMEFIDSRLDWRERQQASNAASKRRERLLMHREVYKYGLHRPHSVVMPAHPN